MISIVVPAHNESAVIERTLRSIRQSASGLEVEIIVVCNGCTDDTADRARAFGSPVRVVETAIASKHHALNLGDEIARGFPRMFIDADVELDQEAIGKVASVLDGDQALAAAPAIEFRLRDRPWTVRAFYRVWSRLPYLRDGLLGTGFYALSKSGRGRFDKFPAITADDGFVLRSFAARERKTVESCRFFVTPPRDLSSVINILTRSHFGTIELEHHFPQMKPEPGTSHTPALLGLAVNPLNWPALAIYAYVRLASRARARRRWRAGDHQRWERDESSRVASD